MLLHIDLDFMCIYIYIQTHICVRVLYIYMRILKFTCVQLVISFSLTYHEWILDLFSSLVMSSCLGKKAQNENPAIQM